MRNDSPTLAYPPHFFKLLIEVSRTLNLLGFKNLRSSGFKDYPSVY